jgi:hypothetical protein
MDPNLYIHHATRAATLRMLIYGCRNFSSSLLDGVGEASMSGKTGMNYTASPVPLCPIGCIEVVEIGAIPDFDIHLRAIAFCQSCFCRKSFWYRHG